MDIHDVSGFPRYIEVLEKQKQVLRDAQSRKGQAPTEIKTRDELIIAHTFHHMLILQETPSDAFKIQSSFLPPPYHPSISPLSALKQAMIKDLVLETHHRGDFVLLRTVTPASTMSAIMAIVEDENEDGVILQLYHQDKSRPAEDILEEGAVLIVKEPFLKTTSDGNIAIRVDHLSDVIFLHVFDKKVPRAWRQFPAEEETSADTWRTRGKNFFKRFKHQFAVEWYAYS